MAESNHRAKSGMGGSKKSKSKSGKKPHSMHIRRGKSGGFIVEHHHMPDEDGMTAPTEEHVVPDLQALQDHVAENMGDQGAAPQSPDPNAQAQSAAPAEAAPAAPAAAPAQGM